MILKLKKCYVFHYYLFIFVIVVSPSYFIVIESEKSECNNSGYKLNWSNLVAATDWGAANSRFLGLVSVGQHDH